MNGVEIWIIFAAIWCCHAQGHCPERYFELNGSCIEQTATCAIHHVLINGICQLATKGSCATNDISVNGHCCSQECINSCQKQRELCCCCPNADLPYLNRLNKQCRNQCGNFCGNEGIPPCSNTPIEIVRPPCANPIPTEPLPTSTMTPLSSTAHPPNSLVRCTDGMVLMDGVCRIIYCNKGIFRDGRCVHTQCPVGTVWTGTQCSSSQPIVHSIILNSTVPIIFNHTEPEVIVHNINNMTVNTNLQMRKINDEGPSLSDIICGSSNSSGICKITPEQIEKDRKCCVVKTPRICRPSSDGARWYCYSKRYTRCGNFCIAPTIYLKAAEVRQTPSQMIVPPNPAIAYCRQSKACLESQNFYDCSGCAVGNIDRCSSYCYSYICSARKCQFYDQRLFCTRYPDEFGCQENDGCVEDWCSIQSDDFID